MEESAGRTFQVGIPGHFDVAAIAFDGQMAGVGSVDADWGSPTPYDSWLDTRCDAYVELMKAHADLVIQKTGGPPTYCHGPKILWWKHERPEVFDGTRSWSASSRSLRKNCRASCSLGTSSAN